MNVTSVKITWKGKDGRPHEEGYTVGMTVIDHDGEGLAYEQTVTAIEISEKVLGTSAVSSQHQTNIAGAVRSILGLDKKGDRIEWVLCQGEVIVRKAKK